jgi:hypothetical protein
MKSRACDRPSVASCCQLPIRDDGDRLVTRRARIFGFTDGRVQAWPFALQSLPYDQKKRAQMYVCRASKAWACCDGELGATLAAASVLCHHLWLIDLDVRLSLGRDGAFAMQIPLQIVFEHVDHSNLIQSHVREAAGKLEQFYGGITSARVVIGKPRHHKGDNLQACACSPADTHTHPTPQTQHRTCRPQMAWQFSPCAPASRRRCRHSTPS